MSGEAWDYTEQNNWNDNSQQPQQNYFDPNNLSNFAQEQSFQTFDYSQTNDYGSQNTSVAGGTGSVPPSSQSYGTPNLFVPAPIMTDMGETGGTLSEEDEPPLLEELGIDPDAILQKTLTVLNPRRSTDPAILQDTDLAGPLVFCLAFGSFLLLAGKLQFGAIYGVGLLGCVALYALLNVMSTNGVALGVVISVLGYCLLPIVGLAGLNVLWSLQGVVGAVAASAAILWCSWSASKLFVTALSMHQQQPLVAYPCALVYSVFALITVF